MRASLLLWTVAILGLVINVARAHHPFSVNYSGKVDPVGHQVAWR